MTREPARALDEEFAALTPPTGITGEAIIHKGRRARMRRRSTLGGAALAGLAVVTALALPPPG